MIRNRRGAASTPPGVFASLANGPRNMRIVTWNLNVRRNVAAQVEAVVRAGADVAGFQEVSVRTWPRLREALAEAGLPFSVTGCGDTGAPSMLDRFVAAASRWPLRECAQAAVPAPECVVAAMVDAPGGAFELVNAHIPTIARGQPLKMATQEAVAIRLREAALRPTVFCGDLNSPIGETPEGEVIPFTRPRDVRGHTAELSILSGLVEHGMFDTYRRANGWLADDRSWWWKNRGKTGGFRLDHIFASREFEVARCWYDHAVRDDRLSDHSLMAAELDWIDAAASHA